MRVVRETSSVLVIHSSATRAKAMCGVAVAVGGFVFLAAVAGFVTALVAGVDIELSNLMMLTGLFAAGGLVFVVVGVRGMVTSEDTDYHFDGPAQRLLIRRKSGQEEEILFSRIVQAETYEGGTDSLAYGLRLELRGQPGVWEMSHDLRENKASLAALARRINNFLMAHHNSATVLAEDRAEGGHLGQLLAPRAPTPAGETLLLVCPICGWQTSAPRDPPPHECEQCQRTSGEAVLLQNRTPGCAIVVKCSCGHTFSVPLSFAGMMRACPECGRKCSVPQPPPRAPKAPKRQAELVDPSTEEEDA
jgi:hypothetical protein